VSTAEQVDGFGLQVQEKAIRAYCKAQGMTLVAILSDEGISGSNGLDTRQGLAEALARIEAREASVLVVYRFDRLARDLILQETLIRRLAEHGADVVSVKEPAIEGDEHTRVMVRQILGVVSQYERAVIRGRMAAGKAQKVATGGYGGGRPGYGQKAENRRLVTNPDEVAIVNAIMDGRRKEWSYRVIATNLEQQGMTTRCGGKWNPNQIRRIAQRAGVA
jgi:DNA invertase Pin-like site-specific DNA recombinase